MKKRICFITTVSITIKSFLIDLIKELDLLGYDVTVICKEDSSLVNELPKNVKYISIPMNRGINVFQSISCTIKLIKIFKSQKYDLIQYSTPNASLYASIAGFIARVPIRLYCQWGIVFVSFSGIKYYIFKAIEKIICQLSTKIEPDSFGNLKFSHQNNLYGPEKSEVIWNGSASGVNLDKFNISKKNIWRQKIREKYQISEEDIVIGFVGRLNRDKGVNELLSAYKELLEKCSNIKLIIIGANDKIHELDSTLYQWSLENPTIIYCGHVTNIEQYFSAMDIFVLPSYREGFGSVVIEAEAMGVPVIVTDIPGPTDAMVDQKTGLIVKKKDVNSLFEAMYELVHNHQMRLLMGQNGIELSTEKFNKEELLRYIIKDRKQLLDKEE